MGARRSGAGRPGGDQLARRILAVLGGLSKDGDMVNVHAVAQRLSSSDEFAERLVESIKVVPAGEELSLPLLFKDEDPDMALVGSGVRGHRLRLTRDETIALLAAFDRVGIDEGNSLRKSVQDSMAAVEVSPSETQRTSGQARETAAPVLERCVAALCEGRRIAFLYQGRLDAHPCRRLVDPTGIHQSEGAWYVDAFDVERHGPRVFRTDRMSSVEDAGAAGPHANPAGQDSRMVTVTFGDPSLATLLWWPGLQVVSRHEGGLVARIPYYGGEWLARRIAACGGTATTDDPELALLVRDVARRQAARLGEGSC